MSNRQQHRSVHYIIENNHILQYVVYVVCDATLQWHDQTTDTQVIIVVIVPDGGKNLAAPQPLFSFPSAAAAAVSLSLKHLGVLLHHSSFHINNVKR